MAWRMDATAVMLPSSSLRPHTRAAAWPMAIATYAPPMGCGPARGSRRGIAPWCGPLIGESPEMREVVERICRIAPSPAAVMIVGESGTGQGACRAAAAPAQHAEQRAVRRRELRRDPRRPGRGRAVRTRARRVHGRGTPASGLFRAGLGRDAVPRRDNGDADRPAGQAAAGARERTHASRRRNRGDRHRRPRRDGDAIARRTRRSAIAVCGRTSSIGLRCSLVRLPPLRRARRRSGAAGQRIPGASSIGSMEPRNGSIARRWPTPGPTRGRETSAN